MYLIVYPQRIIHCFVYINAPASYVHSVICSLVVLCVQIAVATMYQIRCSLKVILKEISIVEAKRNMCIFNTIFVGIWVLNQVGSIMLFFFSAD